MTARLIALSETRMIYDDIPEFDRIMDDPTSDESDLDAALASLAPQGLRDQALRLARSIRNTELKIEAIKSEENRLCERRAGAQRRLDRAKDWLLRLMGTAHVTRVQDASFTISIKPCPKAVEIVDMSAVPAEYMRQPPPQPLAPDKKTILEAFESGHSVTGCQVVQRKRVEIK